jgi:hypothetical protein
VPKANLQAQRFDQDVKERVATGIVQKVDFNLRQNAGKYVESFSWSGWG